MPRSLTNNLEPKLSDELRHSWSCEDNHNNSINIYQQIDSDIRALKNEQWGVRKRHVPAPWLASKGGAYAISINWSAVNKEDSTIGGGGYEEVKLTKGKTVSS
jgi:hypothetical protein